MIVVVATTQHRVPLVEARLGELGALTSNVVATDESHRLVLATVRDDWHAELLATTLRAEGNVAVTRPSDGVRLAAWTQHTEPVRFGDRLSVRFAWSEAARDDGASTVIELGTGGFGSGQHPTTRMVIEQLLTRVHGGERVLDVGCGSGVLGLCAVGLGAASVLAVDVKAEAVEATKRNATLNGMDRRVDATNARLDQIDGDFDVVLANIGRAASVELAPQLVRHVARDGWLVVSGFSPSQCSLVAGFMGPLVELERTTSGDWAALVLA